MLIQVLKIFCDAPELTQFRFQDPATTTMEGLLEFNKHLLFVIIVIVTLVAWLLFVTISNFEEFNTQKSQGFMPVLISTTYQLHHIKNFLLISFVIYLILLVFVDSPVELCNDFTVLQLCGTLFQKVSLGRIVKTRIFNVKFENIPQKGISIINLKEQLAVIFKKNVETVYITTTQGLNRTLILHVLIWFPIAVRISLESIVLDFNGVAVTGVYKRSRSLSKQYNDISKGAACKVLFCSLSWEIKNNTLALRNCQVKPRAKRILAQIIEYEILNLPSQTLSENCLFRKLEILFGQEIIRNYCFLIKNQKNNRISLRIFLRFDKPYFLNSIKKLDMVINGVEFSSIYLATKSNKPFMQRVAHCMAGGRFDEVWTNVVLPTKTNFLPVIAEVEPSLFVKTEPQAFSILYENIPGRLIGHKAEILNEVSRILSRFNLNEIDCGLRKELNYSCFCFRLRITIFANIYFSPNEKSLNIVVGGESFLGVLNPIKFNSTKTFDLPTAMVAPYWEEKVTKIVFCPSSAEFSLIKEVVLTIKEVLHFLSKHIDPETGYFYDINHSKSPNALADYVEKLDFLQASEDFSDRKKFESIEAAILNEFGHTDGCYAFIALLEALFYLLKPGTKSYKIKHIKKIFGNNKTFNESMEDHFFYYPIRRLCNHIQDYMNNHNFELGELIFYDEILKSQDLMEQFIICPSTVSILDDDHSNNLRFVRFLLLLNAYYKSNRSDLCISGLIYAYGDRD